MRRTVPRADAPVQADGRVERAWYDFFRGLSEPRFESTEQAITASAVITIAHGLGAVKWVAPVLVCKSGQFGFSIGDEVAAPLWQETSGYGVQASWDSTNVLLTVGAGIRLLRRDTPGVIGDLTLGNWRLVARIFD